MVFFASSLVGIASSIPYIILGQTAEPKGAMAAQEIYKISPALGSIAAATIRELGLSYLIWGFLAAAISVTAFRRGEIWAWYAFWIGPVFFVGDILNDLSIGGTFWIFDIPFLVVGIVTLFISPQFETILGRHKPGIVPA